MEHAHHDAKGHGNAKDTLAAASAAGTPGKATQPQPHAGDVTATASRDEKKETQPERIARAGHDALHHANRLLDGIAKDLLDPAETIERAQHAVDHAVN